MNTLAILALSALAVLVAVLVILLVWAAAAGIAFTFRVARAVRRGAPLFDGVPNPAPTAGLAAHVALDELILAPMRLLSSMSPAGDYRISDIELDAAVRYYEEKGWLDDPAGYFPTPVSPDSVQVGALQQRHGGVETMRFPSGWQPHPGEPGGDRWRGFRANQEAHATLLRHEDGPRPWLVCIHGQGMGRTSDLDFLLMRQVHRELGANLLLPVLPLHGPRAEGLRSEQQFVSNVYPVNDVLGLSQCMWDLRRILAWLRQDQGAVSIGILGFSLGSYAAALLSTLDADLACVIAVVPSGDLAGALRAAEPVIPSRRRLHRMVHDDRSALVQRVVSPLAMPCLLPRDRRFIIAGQGDRIALPPGVVLLWRHWEKPEIWWRPRGHITTARGRKYVDYLVGIARASGLDGAY